MTLTWKLAWAYAWRHPARMFLTSLAIVASACVVVWVVSGYDALSSQLGEQATGYLGRYDYFVVPEDAQNAFLDSNLIEALQRDPDVAEVTPVMQLPLQRFINPNAMGEMEMDPAGVGRSRAGRGKPSNPTTDADASSPQPGPSAPAGKARPNSPSRTDLANPLAFGFGVTPVLVGTDAEQPPHKLLEGRWIDPNANGQRGAVLGQKVADFLKLKIGDEAIVVLGPKEYRVTLVGLMEEGPSQMGMTRRSRSPNSEKPRTGIEAGPATTALYVPMALAKRFSRDKGKINLINVLLKPEAKSHVAEWRKTWSRRIAESRPLASLLGIDDIRANIEEGMMATRSRQEAWAATGLSLLAALFIIFTTLSMGVTERIRQFAMLRAVGLTRWQVAQVIGIESMILALIGWGGGLLAGWGLLVLVSHMQSSLFANGASLGTGCIVFSGLSAFGGAMAASVLPAWRATSVQPLEAMTPHRSPRPNIGWTVALGICGVGLITVNPMLVYIAATAMSGDKLYYIYMAVGCTTMAVGFLLLTPAMILLVEAVIGPVVARLLRLEPLLLRSQLGSNLWRTLGTTAALTVGLGLFVAMQIWGYSMLEPFKPGSWVPDMLVSFQRGGLAEGDVADVQAIAGMVPGQCIPLAVEQPKLATDITGSEERNSVISQDNVIIVGLDPQIAFGGPDPLLKVRFVEGNPADAIAKLKQGRSCIVPDHFLRAAKLKLGDHFSMVPPNAPTKPVEYTIVGAVSLPGWHWMTKFSGLRRRDGRSAAMVFANYENVRQDFVLNQINFFWMNVDEAFGHKHLAEVRQAEEAKRDSQPPRSAAPANGPPGGAMATPLPSNAKRAAVVKIGEALEPIASRNMGEKQPVNAQGAWTVGATMFGPSVRVSTPDEIRIRISSRASTMIWASCYLPLITLLITSLGVVNTVLASVRARRWEFGILRSQGITRFALFRMILAEGLLIGLLTCILSLGFGVLSGWCGTGISQYVSFFGGLAPPLVIPWAQLSIGFGLALGLCLLAALWPAASTGYTEPLKLLQEGRAAM